MEQEKLLLSPNEVCNWLGITRNQLNWIRHQGRLNYLPGLGREYKYVKKSILDYIEKQQVNDAAGRKLKEIK